MTKSSSPASRSLIALRMPDMPAPMMRTRRPGPAFGPERALGVMPFTGRSPIGIFESQQGFRASHESFWYCPAGSSGIAREGGRPAVAMRINRGTTAIVVALAVALGSCAPSRRAKPSVAPSPQLQSLRVTATAFNSLPDQTDARPTQTAFGGQLRPGMNAIAVSDDLYAIGLR